MRFVTRRLSTTLAAAARTFAAVVLTGPRRSGKTTLLRHVFPRASYVLLEDAATLAQVRADPNGFLDGLKLPVILDEIQNAPELFGFIRARIDARTRERGRWLITGSQDFALMRGVTESMAGRAAILHLLPLSIAESDRVSAFRGGFAEVLSAPRNAELWYQSYLQTYLERDVRAVTQVQDLTAFRRFLQLLASRTAQVLNKTEFAAPLGVSVPTISNWLSVLETTGQIVLVPPYFENFGKRLIKSPKVYWCDSGLVCHLLGIESERALKKSPFFGAIFETLVASEIVKSQIDRGRRRELYFFRDQRGLEVDFLVPGRGGKLWLVEAKGTQTVLPRAADPLVSLRASMGERETRSFLVHAASANPPAGRAVRPGVAATTVADFVAELST
jgi:uncharacterized protein